MTDNKLRVRTQARVQSQKGIVTVVQLIELGFDRRKAYRLLDGSQFDLIMPGVFCSTHWPVGPDQLMFAACLRNKQAIISRLSAAKIWTLRSLPVNDQVHVLVPHGSSPTLPGVVVHRCRVVDLVDVVHRDDGLRVTSPARTLFDCADQLGPTRATSILEQIIDDGHGAFATHAATLARLGSPGRPGTRVMREVLGSRPAWRAAMQSELEVRVLLEIARQGLPAPQVQFHWPLSATERVRLDFAWPQWKLALEVDHPFWHDGAAESRRDKRRDLVLAAQGWQTLRITDIDVSVGLAAAIAHVATVIELRSTI